MLAVFFFKMTTSFIWVFILPRMLSNSWIELARKCVSFCGFGLSCVNQASQSKVMFLSIQFPPQGVHPALDTQLRLPRTYNYL